MPVFNKMCILRISKTGVVLVYLPPGAVMYTSVSSCYWVIVWQKAEDWLLGCRCPVYLFIYFLLCCSTFLLLLVPLPLHLTGQCFRLTSCWGRWGCEQPGQPNTSACCGQMWRAALVRALAASASQSGWLQWCGARDYGSAGMEEKATAAHQPAGRWRLLSHTPALRWFFFAILKPACLCFEIAQSFLRV